MFTKARPNSMWQGTEEKVTQCAAAEFRRFKKVLLYLHWMWLMFGRPWESRWLIHRYFQRRGDQGFSGFTFQWNRESRARSPGDWHFQFVWGRMWVTADNALYICTLLSISEGRAPGIPFNPPCMSVIGDCRGQTVIASNAESLLNAFNILDATLSLSALWPFSLDGI